MVRHTKGGVAWNVNFKTAQNFKWSWIKHENVNQRNFKFVTHESWLKSERFAFDSYPARIGNVLKNSVNFQNQYFGQKQMLRSKLTNGKASSWRTNKSRDKPLISERSLCSDKSFTFLEKCSRIIFTSFANINFLHSSLGCLGVHLNWVFGSNWKRTAFKISFNEPNTEVEDFNSIRSTSTENSLKINFYSFILFLTSFNTRNIAARKSQQLHHSLSVNLLPPFQKSIFITFLSVR